MTARIFAEKVFPAGRRLAWVAGTALIGYGLLVLVMPDALPTTM